MIEDRMDKLNDSIRQLSVQIRELTDLYIGAIETGEMSKLIPIAVKLRNKRKDSKSEFREYSLLDARSIFMDYHRIFGELDSEKLLKRFNVTTVTNINDEDINRFVREVTAEMALAEN